MKVEDLIRHVKFVMDEQGVSPSGVSVLREPNLPSDHSEEHVSIRLHGVKLSEDATTVEPRVSDYEADVEVTIRMNIRVSHQKSLSEAEDNIQEAAYSTSFDVAYSPYGGTPRFDMDVYEVEDVKILHIEPT
jgi:hypothetical protein